MMKYSNMRYSDRIRWRLRGQWALLIGMLVYMVVISELGGGDSRIMDAYANAASRIIFFGGMIYVIGRIVHNKKLLAHRMMMKKQMQQEIDERNCYLHDKSGGIVLDVLLFLLMFTTVTAALFNMPAFYTSAAILVAAAGLKAGAYWFYGRTK